MGYYPRLRDLREDADLTHEELVKLLKMHKTTYTNYEQGKREPPFELIIKLAKFYDVSIDYIAGLSEGTKIKRRPMVASTTSKEIPYLKLFLSSCSFALCKLSLKLFTLTLVFKLLSLFFSLGSCLCLIILSGNFVKMLEVFLLLKKLT